MVCMPCFAVPIMLIIWKFLIQPLIKWWLRSKGQEVKGDQLCPDLIKECKNGTCTLSLKDKKDDAVKKNE